MKEAATLFFMIIIIAIILFSFGTTMKVTNDNPICLLSKDPIMCAELSKRE